MLRTSSWSESESGEQTYNSTPIPDFDMQSSDVEDEEESDEPMQIADDENEEEEQRRRSNARLFGNMGVLDFDRKSEQEKFLAIKEKAASSAQQGALAQPVSDKAATLPATRNQGSNLITDDNPLDVQYALATYYAAMERDAPPSSAPSSSNMDTATINYEEVSLSSYQRVLTPLRPVESPVDMDNDLKWGWYPSSVRRACHSSVAINVSNGLTSNHMIGMIEPIPTLNTILARFGQVDLKASDIVRRNDVSAQEKMRLIKEYVKSAEFQASRIFVFGSGVPNAENNDIKEQRLLHAMWKELIVHYDAKLSRFSLEYFAPLLATTAPFVKHQPTLEHMLHSFKRDVAAAVAKGAQKVALSKQEVWLLRFREDGLNGYASDVALPSTLWKYLPSWSLIYEDFTYFLEIMFPQFWQASALKVPPSGIMAQLDWLYGFAILGESSTFGVHLNVNVEQQRLRESSQKVRAARLWMELMKQYKENGEVKRSTFLSLASSVMLCGSAGGGSSLGTTDAARGVFADETGVRPMWREFYAIEVPVWSWRISTEPMFAFQLIDVVTTTLSGFYEPRVVEKLKSPDSVYALDAIVVQTAATFLCTRENVEWLWSQNMYSWKSMYDQDKKDRVPPWISRFKTVNFDDDADLKMVPLQLQRWIQSNPNEAMAKGMDLIVSTTVGSNRTDVVWPVKNHQKQNSFDVLIPPRFWETETNLGYETYLFSLGQFATLSVKQQEDESKFIRSTGMAPLVTQVLEFIPLHESTQINNDYKFRNPVGLSTTSSFDSIYGQRIQEGFDRFAQQPDVNQPYATIDRIKNELSLLKHVKVGPPGSPLPPMVYDLRATVRPDPRGHKVTNTKIGLEGDTFYGIDIAPDLASYEIVRRNAIEAVRGINEDLKRKQDALLQMHDKMNKIKNAIELEENFAKAKSQLVDFYNEYEAQLDAGFKQSILELQGLSGGRLKQRLLKLINKQEGSLGSFQVQFGEIKKRKMALDIEVPAWRTRTTSSEYGLVYRSKKRTPFSDAVFCFANGYEFTQNPILSRLCFIDVRRPPLWDEIVALNNAYRPSFNSRTSGIRVREYVIKKIEDRFGDTMSAEASRLRVAMMQLADVSTVTPSNRATEEYTIENARMDLEGLQLEFDEQEFANFKPNGSIPRSGKKDDGGPVYPYTEQLTNLSPQHHIEDGGYVKLKSKPIEEIAEQLEQEAINLQDYVASQHSMGVNMHTALVMLESIENSIEALFIRSVQPGIANTNESLENYDILWEQFHSKASGLRPNKRKTMIMANAKQSWTREAMSRFVRLGKTRLSSRSSTVPQNMRGKFKTANMGRNAKAAEETCQKALEYEDAILLELQQLGLVFRYGGYRMKDEGWRPEEDPVPSKKDASRPTLSPWRCWLSQSDDDLDEHTVGKPRAPHANEERKFYSGVLDADRPDLRTWMERMEGDTFQPPKWNVRKVAGQYSVNLVTDIMFGSNSRGLFYDTDSVVNEFCLFAIEYAKLYMGSAQLTDFFLEGSKLDSTSIAVQVANGDVDTTGLMSQAIQILESRLDNQIAISPVLPSSHFEATPVIVGQSVVDASAETASEEQLLDVFNRNGYAFNDKYNRECTDSPSRETLEQFYNALIFQLGVHSMTGPPPAWGTGNLPPLQVVRGLINGEAAFKSTNPTASALQAKLDEFAKEFTNAHINVATMSLLEADPNKRSQMETTRYELESRMARKDHVFKVHVQLCRLGVARRLLLEDSNLSKWASSFVACKIIEQYNACAHGTLFNTGDAYRQAKHELFKSILNGSYANTYAENYTKYLFYNMCVREVEARVSLQFGKLRKMIPAFSMPEQRFNKILETLLLVLLDETKTFEQAYQSQKVENMLLSGSPATNEEKLRVRRTVHLAFLIFKIKGVSTRTRKQYGRHGSGESSRTFPGWIGTRDQANQSIPKRNFPAKHHCPLLEQRATSKRKAARSVPSTENAMAAKAQRSIQQAAGSGRVAATTYGETSALSEDREQSIAVLARDIKLLLLGFDRSDVADEVDDELLEKLKTKYPGVLKSQPSPGSFAGFASLQKYAKDAFDLFSDVYNEQSNGSAGQSLVYSVGTSTSTSTSNAPRAQQNDLAYFEWPDKSRIGTFALNLRKLYLDDEFRRKYYHPLRNMTFSAMARLDREFEEFERGNLSLLKQLQPVSLVEYVNAKQWTTNARTCEFVAQLANRFLYGTLSPTSVLLSVDDFVSTNPSNFNVDGSERKASVMLTEFKLDMQDVQDWELRWNHVGPILDILRREDLYLRTRDVQAGNDVADPSRDFMDSAPCPHMHPFLFDESGAQTKVLYLGSDIREPSSNRQWWENKREEYEKLRDSPGDKQLRASFQSRMLFEKDKQGISKEQVSIPTAQNVLNAISFIMEKGRNPALERARPVVRVIDSELCQNYKAFFDALSKFKRKSNLDRFNALFAKRNLPSSSSPNSAASPESAADAEKSPFVADGVYRPMMAYMPGTRPFQVEKTEDDDKAMWFLNEVVRNYGVLKSVPNSSPSAPPVGLPPSEVATGLFSLMKDDMNEAAQNAYLADLRQRVKEAAALAGVELDANERSVRDELIYLVEQAANFDVQLYPRSQFADQQEQNFADSAFQERFDAWFRETADRIRPLDVRFLFSQRIVHKMRLILDGEQDDLRSDVEFRPDA